MNSNSQFDFKNVRLFARRYLETYYVGVNEDEPPIAHFLIEQGKLLSPSRLRALEIGCGPTVHHALSIAPYVKSLDLADYLPDNLAEIQNWKENKPDSFSWHPYTAMILQEEKKATSPELIDERENILRKKIRNLYHCDVTKSPPLPEVNPYPVVLSFYCAEEVGTTSEEWKKVMKNISVMVSPDGYLFLSALRDTSRYILGDPNGKHEWLPCALITKELLRECLNELGFEPESIDIRSVDTPELVNLGIPGILIAGARKHK
ncbi:MAG: guanitoxin biosynthesis pre-guanitoxin forming N-methyltransferase GntF [bacterium]|nr:guanitoxin biosynthesis pre-guanitoxin forming N-methyltransferase GntF [bacterium]